MHQPLILRVQTLTVMLKLSFLGSTCSFFGSNPHLLAPNTSFRAQSLTFRFQGFICRVESIDCRLEGLLFMHQTCIIRVQSLSVFLYDFYARHAHFLGQTLNSLVQIHRLGPKVWLLGSKASFVESRALTPGLKASYLCTKLSFLGFKPSLFFCMIFMLDMLIFWVEPSSPCSKYIV